MGFWEDRRDTPKGRTKRPAPPTNPVTAQLERVRAGVAELAGSHPDPEVRAGLARLDTQNRIQRFKDVMPTAALDQRQFGTTPPAYAPRAGLGFAHQPPQQARAGALKAPGNQPRPR